MAKWIWKKYEVQGNFTANIQDVSDKNLGLVGHMGHKYLHWQLDSKTGRFTLTEKTSEPVFYTRYENILEGLIVNGERYQFPGAIYKIDDRGIDWKVTEIITAVGQGARGSFIEEIIAEENTYTNNARNSDGYWYVRDRIGDMIFENIKSFNSENRNIKEFYNAGNKIWQAKNTGPGPSELIAGDLQAGFYGEVPSSDFVTGDELCRLAGITAGTSQFSNEPWLKFSYLNETVFVAKKPIRHGISWNHINEKGCVFGEKIVETQGFKFKVTLLKGKTEGKQNDYSAFNGTINHNSMWNRLLGQVHEKAPSNWAYKDNMENTLVNWGINYTDKDLHTNYDYGNGTYAWCQEYGESTSSRMVRGYYGVSISSSSDSDTSRNGGGFRPALILIP